MTRKNYRQRTVALLLCVFLCIGTAFSMIGTAHAADLPASGITIEIMLPTDWASDTAAAKVCVTDETGGGFASVEVKTNRSSTWQDITTRLEPHENRYYGVIDIDKNCTVYVRVTGHDGQVYENSRYMECFDRTPPTVRASVNGENLLVEANDDLSGVAQITVGGKNYTNLSDGMLYVPLKNWENSETISVQAEDHAGNRSQPVQIKNPDYKTPAASNPTQTQQPATGTSTAVPVKPTTTKPAPAATSKPAEADDTKPKTDTEPTAKPLTPDGQASVLDDTTNEDGKQFYTFTTPDENVFYLVIDKQRESENVYLLNAVTESDLQALAEKDQEQPTQTAVPDPEPEPVCNCADKCAPGEVKTDCPVCVLSYENCTGKAPAAVPAPEPEQPEKSSGGTILLVLIAALAVGGVGYYLKIYKPKHDLDDADDFDELTGEDEETINEDEDEPAPRQYAYAEPEEPDDLGGYGGEDET